MDSMKANVFFVCISTLIALLLAYLAYHIAEGKENDIVCGVCSALCFICTLIPVLGMSHKSPRISVNLRVLSIVFFLLFVVSHFCFAACGVRMPYYVIVNAILLLVYMAIYYSIGKKVYDV